MTTDKCFDCPCPDRCAAGVLCNLAPDPARHAHIRNVSALKRNDLTIRPATAAGTIRVVWPADEPAARRPCGSC